jgi:DNA repair ATPase RecN
MNALRLEAEEAQEKTEELKTKVKTLEQENLAKEQEITSLNHRNQLLEGEVEKLETALKEAKDAANQSAQHDTQNESLQRRLQLLEEEVESADRNLRETVEKYDSSLTPYVSSGNDYSLRFVFIDSAKLMSRLVTTNARCRPSNRLVMSGKASMRRWPRSTPSCRRIFTTWRSL